MLRSDTRLPDILEAGIRVLIYVGDKDFICNWVGNRRWVDLLEWSGRDAWLAGADTQWADNWGDGHEAEGLTFLKIYGAVSGVVVLGLLRCLAELGGACYVAEEPAGDWRYGTGWDELA